MMLGALDGRCKKESLPIIGSAVFSNVTCVLLRVCGIAVGLFVA